MSHDGYQEALQLIKIAKENKHTSLELSRLGLSELPPELFELRDLQKLSIRNNPISFLPPAIGRLTNLNALAIYDCEISSIPDEIGRLVNLTELDIDDNKLTTLPDSLENLVNLNHLSFTRNKLRKFPNITSGHTHLERLYLGGNELDEIPSVIGHLSELKTLFLWGGNFTTLPDSFRKLINLEKLQLSSNQLAVFPEVLGDIPKLMELDLGNNQITVVPDTLGNLTNLEILELANNKIAAVPESLESLINLRVLDLSGNQIAYLPDTLDNLSNLSALYLHRNPGLGLPSELLGRPAWTEAASDLTPSDPADIIEYVKRVNANGHPLNEAKLILVGKGAVGKSSLVEKLKYGTFNEGKEQTPGISIERWELPIKGENILLNVWDFGGQEIMHATHQFFLTERSLYLVVLNGREGSEDIEAEYWLKLIESFGGRSPVIIVLNKIRKMAFDLNRSSLLEKYPNIRDFIRTDCEDDESIEKLKQTIIEQTDKLDELRVKFPGEWFSVKDELATTDRNYLSFEEYRKLCADHQVTDLRHQEMLAKYLNQLGIVLNYRDDPRLKDTHVLNPHWVTRGIYKVLNSPLLEQNRGEIKLKDIAGILREPEYPAFMCRFIFDMMKKFDLCFTFPDDDSHYLIPELLPKNQPDDVKEFAPEQCLNFQYQYRVLPEGLLPRFVTRTHFLSDGEPRWRSGVILKFEDCRALVKADISERKVFVSVMGDSAESRRRLLAVVRSDLERIHSEIRNLNPIAMVPLPDAPEVLISYDSLEIMEKNGLAETPQVVRGELRPYHVKDLLHGVDLPKYRTASPRREDTRHEIDVFISYSHKDETFKNELETHLKILQRQNLIHAWSDRDIKPGEKWGEKIDEKLESSEIILILVSADFLASDYCYDIEMKRALERNEKGDGVLVPLVVRECNWQGAPFGKLQALPKDGKAVDSFSKSDEAWTQISKGIEDLAKRLIESKKLRFGE